MNLMNPAPDAWLATVFLGLMGLSMLIYVVLDGFDLGVGVLLRGAREDADRDMMIATIGPFWDANETWLVLGVGILLVAFPLAHGVILGALYLPVAVMLIGLILRGVAFDFRVKAHAGHKRMWDAIFFAGSVTAAFAQGAMTGLYITGLRTSAVELAFAAFTGLALVGGYALLGATWLIIKTEGPLQQQAVRWARLCLPLCAAGILALSVATPLVSPAVFRKWFSLPEMILLLPIPLMTAALFGGAWLVLRRLPARLVRGEQAWAWLPFAATVGVFVLAFIGLAYSLFPYLVMDRITIWEAASAPESLKVILAGVVFVLPAILGYTVLSYRVFRGKASALSYS